MTTPLSIGLIGAGAIARYAFLPGFAPPDSELAARALPDWFHNGCPDARVTAIASRTREKAELLAREFGVPRVYDDWRALVADSDLDAVCVTTPNDLHGEMTIAACKAGKHVLVEKPMALNMREAQAMVEAAQRAGVVLMVHQNQRFFPTHEVAKQILDVQDEDGLPLIGRVLSLRARWSHAGPEYWSPEGKWFFDPARAGHGALFDLGIHKFDLIRFLTGKEVAEVSAFVGTLAKPISVEDNGIALLRFTDGTLGVVEASWTSPPNENSMVLYGTRGSLQIGLDSAYPVSVRLPERPQGIEDRLPPGKWYDNIFAPEISPASRMGGPFRHFVECIKTGRECIASGEDNLKSFVVCMAAFESAAKGRAVRLPLRSSKRTP